MNNDFLDKLKTQSQSIQSSEYIAPQAVTARLHGVRRSRKKAYMSAVAGVLCICVLLSGIVALPQLFGSGVTYAPPRSILKQVANPNHYTDIFGVVKKLKDIAAKEAEAAKAEAANYDNAPIGSDFAGGSAPGGAISNSYDGKYAFSSDETTGQAQLKYSDTNTQVKGVSEADIVKTDGEYIYALKIDYNDMEEVYPADNSEYPEMQAKTYLNINKINNGQITQASRTKLDFYPEEMYVYGDLLIITEVEYTGRYDYSWALSSYYNAVSDIAFRNGYHNTKLHFYNIANHKAPVQSAMLLMQGNCVSTRMINNVLYLVTDYTIPDLQQAEQNSPSSYVPVYKEYDIANGDVVPSNAEDEANATQTTPPPTTIAANAKNASADNATPDTAITESLPPNTSCVPAPDIFICGEPKSAEYITISSIDLNNPTKFADMKSILAGGNQVYCNFNNLFVTVDAYTYNNGWEFTNHTSIVRCAINGTELNIQAEGKVPGSILNQYSMDEKDGFLRIVTLGDHSADINTATPDAVNNADNVSITIQEQSSALYVLDSQLKIVGKTKSVAAGEQIKSVRFDGDICYFVTFRNTDPLYTVDLADPQDPQIVGELKIPGFSEYMHPFGNNLLLGLGQEADIDDGSTQGVKLTMFDVADKTDVKVISNYLLPKDSYSFFANNHKGLFVDSSKQMFGFEYGVYNEAYSYHGETIFYGVYKFADGEFKCAASINLTKLLEKFGKDFYADYSISQTRGFYIDDYFYIVNGDLVCSFKLADFSPVQTVFNK